MADRYIRKLEFNNEVYLPVCPIALEIGAILLDTKADAYFLQLKFANIGIVGISSARICVESLDGAGQLAYPETTVTYDEYTVVGGTFGTKKLLPIPNNNATVFRVYVDKITTIDGNTYTFSRSQYSASLHQSTQHIAVAIREAQSYEVEKQKQAVQPLWRAKRYHVVFAIITLLLLWMSFASVRSFVQMFAWFREEESFILLLFSATSLVSTLFFWYLLISAWVKMGTPIILKRTARMMILSPIAVVLLTLITAIFSWFQWEREWGGSLVQMLLWRLIPTLITVVIYFLIFAIPFLCVYFTVRRHDRSVSLRNALIFWRSH